MSKIATKRQVKTEPRVERPRLHKVILFNDDYTPRDFVVEVLKAVFRLNETQALNVMMTAHRKGRLCGGGVRAGRRRDQGGARH